MGSWVAQLKKVVFECVTPPPGVACAAVKKCVRLASYASMETCDSLYPTYLVVVLGQGGIEHDKIKNWGGNPKKVTAVNIFM